MITILYGEMGVGKSFFGKKLSEDTGIPFVEGDNYLPFSLQTKVLQGKSLTSKDVDWFIKDYFIPALKELSGVNKNFIVSQALYRKKHRKQIEQALGLNKVRFVLISVPFKQQMKQLATRENKVAWIVNALIAKPFFQPGSLVDRIYQISDHRDLYFHGQILSLDKED